MTYQSVPPVTQAVLLLTELAPHLVEEAEPAVLIVDSKGTIRYANKSAEHLVGLPRDMFLGEPVERFVPPESRGKHVGLRNAFIAGTGGPRNRWMGQAQDIRLCTAEGTLIPVRIGLTSLVALMGQYTAVAIYPDPAGQEKPEP